MTYKYKIVFGDIYFLTNYKDKFGLRIEGSNLALVVGDPRCFVVLDLNYDTGDTFEQVVHYKELPFVKGGAVRFLYPIANWRSK